MPDLSHLVWELQSVRKRETFYRKRCAGSPEYINRATWILIAATSSSLALGFIGNVIGILQIDQSRNDVFAAYIILLIIESVLLFADCIVCFMVSSSWFHRKMPEVEIGDDEIYLKRFSIFNALAICFFSDFGTNVLKFSYLHIMRFTSPDINVPLLISGALCTFGQVIKVVLVILHFIWKQMALTMDPLEEKGPEYFQNAPLTNSLLWGICMMMPPVNMLLAASAMCMSFMTNTV